MEGERFEVGRIKQRDQNETSFVSQLYQDRVAEETSK